MKINFGKVLIGLGLAAVGVAVVGTVVNKVVANKNSQATEEVDEKVEIRVEEAKVEKIFKAVGTIGAGLVAAGIVVNSLQKAKIEEVKLYKLPNTNNTISDKNIKDALACTDLAFELRDFVMEQYGKVSKEEFIKAIDAADTMLIQVDNILSFGENNLETMTDELIKKEYNGGILNAVADALITMNNITRKAGV